MNVHVSLNIAVDGDLNSIFNLARYKVILITWLKFADLLIPREQMLFRRIFQQ